VNLFTEVYISVWLRAGMFVAIEHFRFSIIFAG
jgi:hypothetical protein